MPRCLCGSEVIEHLIVNDIDTLRCGSCGILRQHVAMSEKAYDNFYRQDYYDHRYTHSREQDDNTAERRLWAHRKHLSGRVLDIGSGNGAFVRACMKFNIEAWGQDVADAGLPDRTYIGTLESISFPSDWAGTVTMHDVLEHVTNPKAMLGEAARILKPGGFLIVDYPDFEASSGRHHWKPVEHLWFLGRDQLTALIADSGFVVESVVRPIPGKIVVYARRQPDKRASVLVPPGIGDIYWVLVKLKGFAAAKGVDLPCDIWIDAPDDRKRSLQFVERVPFVRAAGYHTPDVPRHPKDLGVHWRNRIAEVYTKDSRGEAYGTDGRHAFENVDGKDWFLSFNGSMVAGRSLARMDPEWPVDWDIPFFVSKSEGAYGRAARSRIGPYIVAAFFNAGFYAKWLAELPAEDIYALLARVADATGRKIVLTGAGWDRKQAVNMRLLDLDGKHKRLVSLIGKTTLEEYFGLLRHADGCIGFPAGNTMMGPAFGIPTVLIWNDHFDKRMHVNALPPVANYRAANTSDGAAAIAARCIEIMEG